MKKMRRTTKVIPLLLLALILAALPLAGTACGDDEGLNAKFTPSVTSGDIPLDVTFTDQSEGDPVSWAWDFGDGTTSTEQSPTHTYTTAEVFTVVLKVTDADGETDTATATISSTGIIWPKMSITMQTAYAQADITGIMADKFKELLELHTDGNVTVDIDYGGVPVSHSEMFEALRTGAIDASVTNQGYLRAFNKNFDFSGQLQGLIITQAHGDAVYSDTQYRTFIENLFEAYDIQLVDYVPTYIVFTYFCEDEIDSLWDLDGKKLYLGSRDGVLDPAAALLGVTENVLFDPTQLKFGVDNDLIDAQATPPSLAITFFDSPGAFDHVLLRPFYNTNCILIAQDVWEDMPGELQALIDDVIMPEVKTYSLSKVVDNHVTYIQQVLDLVDTAHVEQPAEEEEIWNLLKVDDNFLDWAADMDQGTYNLILSLRPEYTDFDPIVKEILDELTFNGAPLEYSTGY